MYNPRADRKARKTIRARFHGHATLRSRHVPAYPITAEREYMRLTSRYLKLARGLLQKRLPGLMKAYRREMRLDDRERAEDRADREIAEMTKRLERILVLFGLESQIWKIAKIAKNTSVREWLRAVKRTFGIDLETGYYNGEFFDEILNPWVSDNVRRMQAFPQTVLNGASHEIRKGIRDGLKTSAIVTAVWAIFNRAAGEMRATARNQIGSLNSAMSRKEQTDAGCSSYCWATSGDDRVRACHAALNGKTIRWDSPPEMWYVTKRGIVHTGRTCHPGEDYNCRCTAVPVFERDFINLPVRNVDDGEFAGGTLTQWQESARNARWETRSGH